MAVKKTTPNSTDENEKGSNPGFEVMQEEQLSGLLAVELDIQKAYPETNEINTRVYRIVEMGKKKFLDNIEGIPDESQIKQLFGGGSYCLMFFVIKNEKQEFTMRSVNVHIEGKPKNTEDAAINPVLPSQNNEKEDSDDKFLNKLILLKQAGLLGSPSADSGGGKAMEVMGTMFTAMMGILTSTITSGNKNPDLTLMKELIPTLLNNSLKKNNPVEDFKQLMEIKSMMDSGGGSDNGGFWGDILKAGLPLIGQLAMNSQMGNGANIPVSPGLSEERIKEIAAQTTKDIINDEFPPEDAYIEPENHAGKPQESVSQPTTGNEDNNSNNQNKQQDMQLLINALKTAPKERKIEALQTYLKQYPVEAVKKFVLDNGILADENEFNEYLKLAGVEVPAK